MSLRILYSFPDILGAPGVGTTAAEQIRGLVALGHDVSVCATSVAARIPGLRRLSTTLTFAGQRVPHGVLGVARSQRYHDRRAASLLRCLENDVDVVHCWPTATLQTAAAARELGIPSLREVPNTHTAHAYDVAAAESARLGVAQVSGHSHTRDADRLAIEQAEYDAVDMLLVPSRYSLETFVARGIARDRLALHRYGCDPRRFDPLPEAPGADANRGLTAIFVGSLEPRKGLHHALHAWLASGACTRGRLVVLGSFVPGYREALANEMSHASIELRGFVDDVPAQMRLADVMMFPSLEEGSALVTYEAQAAGCVLLVSDAAGARCDHNVHGLVHKAGDVATLTEQLRRLDRDREELRRLRRSALEHVPELTWDNAARELADIYAATLCRSRAASTSSSTSAIRPTSNRRS